MLSHSLRLDILLQLDGFVENWLFLKFAVYLFGLSLINYQTFRLKLTIVLRLHIAADVFVYLLENRLRQRSLVGTSLFVAVR